MGNQLVREDYDDLLGPGENLAFFKSLNLKWIDFFFAKVKEEQLIQFQIDKKDKISWPLYFKTLTWIRDNFEKATELELRSLCHPATQGYLMEKSSEAREETIQVRIEHGKPDDYTDDEPSDHSDEEDEEEEEEDTTIKSISNIDSSSESTIKSKKFSIGEIEIKTIHKRNPIWDPSITNPIFFGYQQTTIKSKEIIEKEKQDAIHLRENRAIKTAKETRMNLIDGYERSIQLQENSRLKRMTEIEESYEKARIKREEDLEANQKTLPDFAFRQYKIQQDIESQAADTAYQTELSNLREIHQLKTHNSLQTLENKRLEIEAFKEIDKQDTPAAEKLEELAKIEISRWVDELNTRGKELEKFQLEFCEIREEYEKKVLASGQGTKNEGSSTGGGGGAGGIANTSNNNNSNNNKDKSQLKMIQELKSMTNIAETRVREAQKSVETAIESLLDAEALLSRASHLRQQQDRLLPLFAKLAQEKSPSHCSLELLASGLVLLMNGSFDQKCSFFLRLYDFQCAGLFSFDFLLKVIDIFQESMYLLDFLPFRMEKERMINEVTRGYLDLGLRPNKDSLTEFELKEFLITILSKSLLLTESLGLHLRPGGNMGTYQRNRMTPLALYSRGMLSISACKYRVHFERTTHRPLLDPNQKQLIHERALAMGEGDPIKADYTKFISKPKRTRESQIDPLDHGHLHHYQFVEKRIHDDAATKIQSLYRSYMHRKIAEKAARFQAFLEAKELALKDMRSKVVREFRKREGTSGMGRMKWDAQVRMKQAKMRASGQAVSRSDAVMALMEEAIEKASQQIEERFKKVAEKEDFAGMDLNGQKKDGAEGERDPTQLDLGGDTEGVDLGKLFGMVVRSPVGDESQLIQPDSKGREDREDGDGDGGEVGKKSSSNSMLISSPRGAATSSSSSSSSSSSLSSSSSSLSSSSSSSSSPSLSPLTRDLTLKYIQGDYLLSLCLNNSIHSLDPNIKGETQLQRDFRTTMTSPEPEPTHLLNRLLKLQNSLTLFKVRKILAELPSKRLLLKFISHLSNEELIKEFQYHFLIKKNLSQLVRYFRLILQTDYETGLYIQETKEFEKKYEFILNEFSVNRSMKIIEEMSNTIDRRIETNLETTETQLINIEMDKIRTNSIKYQQQMKEMLENIEKLKDRLNRLLLTCSEVERRYVCVTYLQRKRLFGERIEIPIALEDRFNWIVRLRYSLRASENTPSEALGKYNEIRSTCREFLSLATADAVSIINEHFQPRYRKTIPVSHEYVVDGRQKECGRGLEGGVYYTYEAHNIIYEVNQDYHGVFNGSDEYAMKSAGNNRVAALEYFKTHTPLLNIPLVATIDYSGFRVTATTKLPVQRMIFSEDGELRRVTEDKIHGVEKHGEHFINKSRSLQSALKLTATKLNLAEHTCKGSKDISHTSTFCSSDITGYKGYDEEYYLNQFWHAFPPETPEQTSHLPHVPRDQSIFWRLLRPEFVSTYHKPLSPDAGGLITIHTSDKKTQYLEVKNATHKLISETIPALAESLSTRNFSLPLSEGLGLDLVKDFHGNGVNIRHMGVLRSRFWRKLPGVCSLFFNTSSIRTFSDLRGEVYDGDRVRFLSIDTECHVKETPRSRIDHRSIPIESSYLGMPLTRLQAWAGKVSSDRNSSSLRAVLLAEMTARTVKSMIRSQLRIYSQRMKCTSSQFTSSVICDYLNVLSGSSATTNITLSECIFDGIKQRFGSCAVQPSEKNNFYLHLSPCIVYLVKRLQSMLGIQLSSSCLGEFNERPSGFSFSPLDLLEILPVVKHNIPVISMADAKLATLKAQEVSGMTYQGEVLRDNPVLFFRLSERKGAKTAENKGSLGLGVNHQKEIKEKKEKKEKEKNEKKMSHHKNKSLSSSPSSDIDTPPISSSSSSSSSKLPPPLHGYFTSGCVLEQSGPIPLDPFCRSVLFEPKHKSCLDSKFHPSISTQHLSTHFSVEVFVRIVGSTDTTRTILMCGRYEIVVGRDNCFSFIFMDEMYQTQIRMSPCPLGEWVHLMCCYDGTTLKCFVNAEQVSSVEMEEPMRLRRKEFQDEMDQRRMGLEKEEKKERAAMKEKSQNEAFKYFQTRDGQLAMKRSSESILEAEEFQFEEDQDDENGPRGGGGGGVVGDGKDEQLTIKERKIEAMKKAKAKYATDLYVKNVKEVAEKFKLFREELNDRILKQQEEGISRSRKGLRIGASLSSGSSSSEGVGVGGSNYFHGNISSLSIYDVCLSIDRIRVHYFSASTDKTLDAQRLYSISASKYEEAFSFASNDLTVLKGFARSLCEYLRVEMNEKSTPGVSRGKIKILEAIEEFRIRNIPDAIAEILLALPREIEFAEIICQGFQAIKSLDHNYFSQPHSPMNCSHLSSLPELYGLDEPSAKMEYIECAANIYREVVKDVQLRFSYGDMDLSLLTFLKSSELVISLVRHAREDKHLNIIQVGDIFRNAGRDVVNLEDEDVMTICAYLMLTIGFDLSGCLRLTNLAVDSLYKMSKLRILNLSGCVNIDDEGIRKVAYLEDTLEVLDLSGLFLISDISLHHLSKNCPNLSVLKVNKCLLITQDGLMNIAKSNKRLSTLHISGVQISDHGLALLSNLFSKSTFTSLDLSHCRDISDTGIIALSENCPRLKSLNLCGLSRITDKGTQAICSRCWEIQDMNCEDVFLLTDEGFWFSPYFDGRVEANEKMLKSLERLTLKDCVNLTDRGLEGLAERCRKIELLNLRGCDRITNHGLSLLKENYFSSFSLCDSLRVLDVSYCGKITASGLLMILPFCGVLEELLISGMSTADDPFIQAVCTSCPTLLRMNLSKCHFISDVSLCSFADHLWLEGIDISGCPRISDQGIEVLTASCSGLIECIAERTPLLTDHAINSLGRNCLSLRRVNVKDAGRGGSVGGGGISLQVLMDLKRLQPLVHIISSYEMSILEEN